jgi:acylphosphatase
LIAIERPIMTGKQVRFVVRYCGHVQGVGFRITAISHANGLGVHGLVRNESDGSVVMDVEGDVGEVKELMRRIDASMVGKIDSVDVLQRPPRGDDSGFHIHH